MSRETSPLPAIFNAGVSAVNGKNAVTKALQNYSAESIYLIAVGKAAAAMTEGALSVVSDRLVRGLVISKYDHINEELKNDSRLEWVESAHPVPDTNSLAAGDKLISFLSNMPKFASLLFLTSGGASALVEVLPEGMTLDDLQKVNQYLLGGGLDINEMNVIRKSLSSIKGGRLAAHVHCTESLQLLISDVPGDSLHSIGSGLLIQPAPDIPKMDIPTTDSVPSDSGDIPDWLIALQNRNIDPPDATAPVWKTIESRIVASNDIACSAATECATQLGLDVRLADGELTGDVADMARVMTATLTDENAAAGVYIWGGETTVQLPESPGRGGRNQQLALQLACDINSKFAENKVTGKQTREWELLVCGTDGSDGPTPDAGGLVNAGTLHIGDALGLNADEYLANADAGSYLEATQGLVTTGPSGTNVMDLAVVILR